MPVLMSDDTYTAQTAPPFDCHIRREGEERSLCGSKFGSYAVARPGADLPHLLPSEEMCAECAAAHVGGIA